MIAVIISDCLHTQYVAANDSEYYFPDVSNNVLVSVDEYEPDDMTEEDVLLEEESEQTNQSDQTLDGLNKTIDLFHMYAESNSRLSEKNVANASFFRSVNEHAINNHEANSLKYGCMQNFAIFKNNTDTYLVRSMGGGLSATATVYVERRSLYGNAALAFRSELYNQEGYPVPTFQYTGHGENIEIVEHQGHTYVLFIEGNKKFVKKVKVNGVWKDKYKVIGPYKLSMIELIFDERGSFSLGEKRTLELFNTYGDDKIPSVESKLATSDNYLCISVSYGKTNGIRNDRERYMVYDKRDFIESILNGAKSQQATSIQSCRCATGWFTGDDSIGMVVPFSRAVVQCIALDEKKNDSGKLTNFIIMAAIDDRGTGGKTSTNGRKTHCITRAYLTPKEPGSSSSRVAQNMANNTCYYSKITHITYTGSGGSLEHSLNSSPGGLTSGRTELEGLKKIKNQGNGIPAGWYISTHNARFANRLPKKTPIPFYGNLPPYTSESVPWNSMVYKVTMTPVSKWNGN